MQRVGSRARHGGGAARRCGAGCARAGIGVPPGRVTSYSVAAVTQLPADRWRWPISAVPVVPVRTARKCEREQKRHRRVARPEIAHVPAPGIFAWSGPTVGVDRVPGDEQVTDLEVHVRAGRIVMTDMADNPRVTATVL